MRRILTWFVLCAAFAAARADTAALAPDFSYPDVNPASASHGERLSLGELLGERGVVLNFLASWCTYCWVELPELQKLHDEAGSPIVGIAADEYGPPDDLLRRVAGAGLTLPILLVPREEIPEMEGKYRHSVLPATYVIAPGRKIVRLFEGAVEGGELKRAIEAGLPPAPTAPR